MSRSRRTPNRQAIFRPSDTDSDISTSDDETFAAEEDQPQILSDDSSIVTEASADARAIPIHVKKSFALVIHANGGIDHFALAAFVDEDKYKTYGDPSSSLRKRYKNLINRWRNGWRTEYENLVAPAEETDKLKTPERANRPPRTPSSSARRNLPSSTRRRQQLPEPPTPPTVRRVVRNESPRPFQPRSPTILQQPANMANQFAANLLNLPHSTYYCFASSLLSLYQNHSFLTVYFYAETIHVNTDFPERNNGPFFITDFANHVHNGGLLYNGFQFRYPDVDLRQLVGNDRPAFQAWFLGDIQVFVQVPASNPTFMNNAEAFATGMRAANYNRPRIMEAFNVARNEIISSEDRQFIYFLLIFDDAHLHGLDNSIFSSGLDNNRVQPTVIPVVSTFEVQTPSGTATLTSQRADIVWDIAMVEPFPRQVTEAAPRVNDLTSQLTSALGNLGIN